LSAVLWVRLGNRVDIRKTTDPHAMAAEPKPKAAWPKKRRRTLPEQFVDYVVEIEGWDWGGNVEVVRLARGRSY
jgi:hypothetical protein